MEDPTRSVVGFGEENHLGSANVGDVAGGNILRGMDADRVLAFIEQEFSANRRLLAEAQERHQMLLVSQIRDLERQLQHQQQSEDIWRATDRSEREARRREVDSQAARSAAWRARVDHLLLLSGIGYVVLVLCIVVIAVTLALHILEVR